MKLTVWRNWWQLMKNRDTAEKRLAFIEAIFAYAFEGKTPNMNPSNGVEYAAMDGFLCAQNIIDSENRAIEFGKRGGRPRKVKTEDGGDGSEAPVREQLGLFGENEVLGVKRVGRPRKVKPAEASDGTHEDAPTGAADDGKESVKPKPTGATGAKERVNAPDVSNTPSGSPNDDGPISSAPPDEIPKNYVTLEDVIERCHRFGATKEFAQRFFDDMNKRDWCYNNKHGQRVRVVKMNLATVVQSFWAYDDANPNRKPRPNAPPSTTVHKQDGYKIANEESL